MPGADLLTTFESIDSVVVAEFDLAGQLLGGNAGLRRISREPVLSLWQLLSQPDVGALIGAQADGAGQLYAGLLTARGAGDSMVTLRGTLCRSADRLHLVAGYDMQEFEALSASLLALNDEINDAYRALAHSKQVLQDREAEILRLSLMDALTGVGNRRMLNEALLREVERATRQGQPLSLLILDIDHFKRVNDTWGHETGDRVLKETGGLLLRGIRPTDIATRMGGEEFVVLLPATPLDDALVCAERLRAALAVHNVGLPAPVTSSFGVSTLRPGEAGGELLARADAALYQAKQQGRNRVVAATQTAAPQPADPSTLETIS